VRLLLHACCGPCATYPVKHLQESGIDFATYYFNPNIHPLKEHLERGVSLKKLAEQKEFDLIYSTEYAQADWDNIIGDLPNRCTLCYQMRLEETARQAKLRGFDAFSTTLLISPYQEHERIKKLAREIAEDFDIEFYYMDFRPFFREGQGLARKAALYMQKYCGCICSLEGNGR